MPSSQTTSLLAELQAAGENLNTWGDGKLNTAIQMLEAGSHGLTSHTLTANLSLTYTNYTLTDGTDMCHKFASASDGAYTVTVGNYERAYLIWNDSGFDQTIACSGGTSATVYDGETIPIYCDGTNVERLTLKHVEAPTIDTHPSTKKYVDDQDTAVAASIVASEAAAAASEAAAAVSETNAAASESAAGASETAAGVSETNAAASYDSFDDRYLGAKSSDPTLDNDGDPLLTGALYWNTTDDTFRAYSGTAWEIFGTGSISTQEASAVAITGGTIDGTIIGGTTPAAGDFTDILATNYYGATDTAVNFYSDTDFVFNLDADADGANSLSVKNGAAATIFIVDENGVLTAESNIVSTNGTIGGLTAAELGELGNIGATTISAAQWGYLGATSAFGATIIDDANAAAVQTTLGLVPGTDVQAYDAGLLSIAGLTTLADRMIYTTASDTYAVATLTAAGRALIDDATASAQRTTMGVAIGSDVQAYNTKLDTYVANNLTVNELTQLQNIDALTISAAQWGYVGGADQAVKTSDAVVFANLDGIIGANTPAMGTFTTVDVLHTATTDDDHALEVVVDAAGFGDVKAIDITYTTGAITTACSEGVLLSNIDESLSTGGEVYALEVLTTSLGSAKIVGLKTGINVHPVEQFVGTFGDAASILVLAVDQLTALSDGGAGNISVFVADNDTITIGFASKFEEIEMLVDTGASGSGIAPVFEFSTGVGTWATFVPTDGTNGFRNTGSILWDDASVPTWAVGTGSEYLVRITRTKNSLTTAPILDEIQVSAVTEYSWDKDGAVSVASQTCDGAALFGTTSGGTYDGNWYINPNDQYPAIELRTAGTAKARIQGTANTGTVYYDHAGDVIWRDAIGGSQIATLTNAGNFAIGVAVPLDKFHLEGGQLRISDSAAQYIVFDPTQATADYQLEIALTDSGVSYSTNAGTRGHIFKNGGTAALTVDTNSNLVLAGDTVNVATQKTPASASAAGVKGDIVHDANYIYICTATNTWKRVAIATW